jgi:hypothetical protein
MDVDSTILVMIREMAKIPSSIKAWKAPVIELLNDNRLFTCTSEAAKQWRPIVKSLFEIDKTSFTELLGTVLLMLSRS